MNILNLAFELLKILLPCIVVFATAYYSIKLFIRNEQIKKSLDNKSQIQKDILMLRLQAYERMVIFLERIAPSNLMIRLDMEGLTAEQFQLQLLTVIRAEYEHNLAQQLYVSPKAWQALIAAKEEIIKLINISKERLTTENSALNLSRSIIGNMLEKQSTTTIAIEFIKKEAASLL